jgi:alkyl hydroperoxide reductase subunit F
MHDLIIIGAGPAGITASVYAARKRMNFIVISKDVGGQAAYSGDIENYTGYQFIAGPELTAKFEEHMKKYNVGLKSDEEVIGLNKQDNVIIIDTDKGRYQTKTVIVSSGKRAKELNIPGEKTFKNRGLTYCATCDGPLFANKDVAVVGGGNSALDAALQLIKIANHIYLINLTSALSGDPIMQEKLKSNNKMTILNNTAVTAILGDKFVKEIRITSQGKERSLSVEGVFVEIGLVPNSEFAKGLEKNERGEIKIDSYNRTNIAGIFAAGDVTNIPEKQIVIAAGEGAKATLSAFRYLALQE